jgi:hypothetical protein
MARKQLEQVRFFNCLQAAEEWHAECSYCRRQRAYATPCAGLRDSCHCGCWCMGWFVPVRAACFVMVAACGALCQQRPENASSLPDAPTGRPPAQANLNGAAQFRNSFFQQEKPQQNVARDFFSRYLYPTLPKRNLNDHPANDGLVYRATYAALRTLITRDDSGKARLNTSYLLRTLTSVAMDTASTPSWKRHVGSPFSDFGSTVGNDVGMNVFHEFEPGLEKMLKSHAPKFVSMGQHSRHK